MIDMEVKISLDLNQQFLLVKTGGFSSFFIFLDFNEEIGLLIL